MTGGSWTPRVRPLEGGPPVQGVPVPGAVLLPVQPGGVVGAVRQVAGAPLHGQVLHVPVLVKVVLVRLPALGRARQVQAEGRLRAGLQLGQLALALRDLRRPQVSSVPAAAEPRATAPRAPRAFSSSVRLARLRLWRLRLSGLRQTVVSAPMAARAAARAARVYTRLPARPPGGSAGSAGAASSSSLLLLDAKCWAAAAAQPPSWAWDLRCCWT